MKHYSSLNLTNALINFSKRGGLFFECGFNQPWLEIKMVTDKGTVIADLVNHSAKKNHTKIFEIKGGKVDSNQAEKYASINTRVLDVSIPFCKKELENSYKFQISYVCHERNYSEVEAILKKLKTNFPIIQFDFDNNKNLHRVSIQSGAIQESELASKLIGNYYFDFDKIFPYIPFDAQSDNSEVLDYIIPQLLRSALKKKPFTTNEILGKVYGHWWKAMAAERRKELISLVEGTINNCAQNKLKESLVKGQDGWRFVGFDSNNLASLQTRLSECVSLLKGVTTSQIPLFDVQQLAVDSQN